MHREAALSRPSRPFKVGASERSPPLWPGINVTLTLQGDADRFTREARTGKGVQVLNRFRCSSNGSLQNYPIIALSFLRNCDKKRYSTARFSSPSSSTARARPREVTGQPLYRSASTKRCMHDHLNFHIKEPLRREYGVCCYLRSGHGYRATATREEAVGGE